MNTVAAFWGQLGEVQVAALPPLVVMQVWLRLGWGLVLTALLVLAWGRVGGTQAGVSRMGVRRVLVVAVLLWCALPGASSPAYWLGLAFQAPSLSAGALALLVLLRAGLAGQAPVVHARETLVQARRWAGAAVLLGWALLLDTFALWPLALYPWGFGVLVWVVLLAVAWLPWAWGGGALRGHAAGVWLSGALLAFAALRLPSGNVWDAMLDPWLWGLAHVVVLQEICFRYKKQSGLRLIDGG